MAGRGEGAVKAVGGSRMKEMTAAMKALPRYLAGTVELCSKAMLHPVCLLLSKWAFGPPSPDECKLVAALTLEALSKCGLCRTRLRVAQLLSIVEIQFDKNVSILICSVVVVTGFLFLFIFVICRNGKVRSLTFFFFVFFQSPEYLKQKLLKDAARARGLATQKKQLALAKIALKKPLGKRSVAEINAVGRENVKTRKCSKAKDEEKGLPFYLPLVLTALNQVTGNSISENSQLLAVSYKCIVNGWTKKIIGLGEDGLFTCEGKSFRYLTMNRRNKQLSINDFLANFLTKKMSRLSRSVGSRGNQKRESGYGMVWYRTSTNVPWKSWKSLKN